MSKHMNTAFARWGIMLALLSLLGIMTVFELGMNIAWNTTLKISCISFLAILFVSYFFGFIKTGIWNFTHKPLSVLDERDIKLISKSLRIAYAIFSVMILIILYLFAVFEIRVSMVLAAGLLLFAHFLPGAVIVFSGQRLKF